MIPGAQKFFKRQPSSYELSLQDQVTQLKAELDDVKKWNNGFASTLDSLGKAIAEYDLEHKRALDELRREMLGYIKPEAPKEEEPAPTGFQTFTQRRRGAAAQGATQKVREVAAKTEEVLKLEKANG